MPMNDMKARVSYRPEDYITSHHMDQPPYTYGLYNHRPKPKWKKKHTQNVKSLRNGKTRNMKGRYQRKLIYRRDDKLGETDKANNNSMARHET